MNRWRWVQVAALIGMVGGMVADSPWFAVASLAACFLSMFVLDWRGP